MRRRGARRPLGGKCDFCLCSERVRARARARQSCSGEVLLLRPTRFELRLSFTFRGVGPGGGAKIRAAEGGRRRGDREKARPSAARHPIKEEATGSSFHSCASARWSLSSVWVLLGWLLLWGSVCGRGREGVESALSSSSLEREGRAAKRQLLSRALPVAAQRDKTARKSSSGSGGEADRSGDRADSTGVYPTPSLPS